MSPALSSGSGLIMFCCLFIICSSSLKRCHHLVIIFFIMFLSSFCHLCHVLPSLFTVIIFICVYHRFAIFIIIHSSPYHLSCHLYRPPFLSLSSVSSSLSSSNPLRIIFLSSCSSANPFSHHLPYHRFFVGHLRRRHKFPSA